MLRLLCFVSLLCLQTVCCGQVQQQKLFKDWDANKDGKLQKTEVPAGILANFDQADTDSSGLISLNELQAYMSRASQNRLRRMLTKIDVKKDVAYVEDGHERQKLDLYLPKNSTGKRPLVIWIHGGGWRQGSKKNCRAIPLVERGFVVASINYRLSSHAVFPAQIHDCKAAVRWLRRHADLHGIDESKIGVWGSSAGGHLAALLGTSGDVKELAGVDVGDDGSCRIQAVCDWFGPTNLLLMNKQAGSLGKMDHDSVSSPESLLLGGELQTVPDKAAAANPISYVTSDDPPFLILHGDIDPLVPVKQSQMLYDALLAANCDAEFTIVEGEGHGFRDPQWLQRSLKFFESTLLPATTDTP